MTNAEAASRNPDKKCFICETDDLEAEAGLEAYVCPVCLFQAVDTARPDTQELNDAE